MKLGTFLYELIAQEIVCKIVDVKPSVVPQRDINQKPVTRAPIR